MEWTVEYNAMHSRTGEDKRRWGRCVGFGGDIIMTCFDMGLVRW